MGPLETLVVLVGGGGRVGLGWGGGRGQAVKECRGSYGLLKYVAFLRGAGSVPEWCKARPGYGRGAGRPAEWWKGLAQQLLAATPPLLQEHTRAGYANGRQQSFTVIQLSPHGTRFLASGPGAPLVLPLPLEMEIIEEKTARPAAARDAAAGAGKADALDALSYSPGGAARCKAGRRALEGEEEELLRRLHGVREKLAARDKVALSLVCQVCAPGRVDGTMKRYGHEIFEREWTLNSHGG